MAKRTRVPAPLPRLFPSVVRTFGPRLMLVAAGCAALLLVGGSSYLISHATTMRQPAAQKAKLQDVSNAAADAQVLGDSTTQSSGGDSGAGSTPSSGTAQGSAVPDPRASSGATPACDLACAHSSTPGAIADPSFDITVSTKAIQKRALGTIYIPFSVVRHGGLSTLIVPGSVTISSGGSLTNLITVQSAVMLDSDHGAITLVPVGLFPHDISVKISASSGAATASTLFSYHIGD